ncbi:Os03g0704700 [Oryza sativa Japonica Group]|uniref:Os03g0704700 protein n=1 Tax=Oryza sativa subsp. japonica TaxID=39947 RepID=A0A0P0W1Z3_ORYSJ|nr:hypothetical protein EE612_019923 [Oryza sativa]BAS85970.1 Os03g0704700 [Oryza sativa Japonica Group]
MFPRMSTSEMVGPGDTAAAVAVSTERLRQRLQQEGVSEAAIADSERIVRTEFEVLHKQLMLLKQKQTLLLDTLRQLEKEVLVNLMIIMNHKIQLKTKLTMMRIYILIHEISCHQVLLKAVDLISKDQKLVRMMRMIIQWMVLIPL